MSPFSADATDQVADYYEVLQISANAEPDTIHRVYRLLAQRFHPDNRDTGNEAKFRVLSQAYGVLSDPEKRAQYDILHLRRRQERWRLVSEGAKAEDGFDGEQTTRLTVLEALYTRRRLEPHSPGIFSLELEDLTGRPREHLEFTIWYLIQKNLVQRSDNSRLIITAEGVDYLEENYQVGQQRRRLQARNQPA
jgi:curved DNA-binding protein CbpA